MTSARPHSGWLAPRPRPGEAEAESRRFRGATKQERGSSRKNRPPCDTTPARYPGSMFAWCALLLATCGPIACGPAVEEPWNPYAEVREQMRRNPYWAPYARLTFANPYRSELVWLRTSAPGELPAIAANPYRSESPAAPASSSLTGAPLPEVPSNPYRF